MKEIEDRFSAALHNTARAWRQALDRRLKYLGVSQAAWMTIAQAAKAAQPLSQSAMADRLGVEGATMVAMVDRLVKAGLVEREPCQSDRRVKRIKLTAAGNEIYEKVRGEAEKFRSELLQHIDHAKIREATLLLEQLQSLAEQTLSDPP